MSPGDCVYVDTCCQMERTHNEKKISSEKAAPTIVCGASLQKAEQLHSQLAASVFVCMLQKSVAGSCFMFKLNRVCVS